MAGDFTTVQTFLDWVDNPVNLNEPLYVYDADNDCVKELDPRRDFNRITVVWDVTRQYKVQFGIYNYDVTELYINASDVVTSIGWT